MAACIATWTFGLTAVETCRTSLLQNCSALDAVEHGIVEVEQQEELGCYLVGRGGMPTSAGELELDAAVMDGTTARFGAVASLQGVASAFPVARLVMEKSPHSMLVSHGALSFAKSHHIHTEPREALLGKQSMDRYQKYCEEGKQAVPEGGHDTLGLIALDTQGNIAVGVATSGMPFKAPGRVGDSPLPGPGLYADFNGNDPAVEVKLYGRYGAACATGDGDHILRFCPSSRVVALLGTMHPMQACRTVVDDIVALWRQVEKGKPLLEIGIIAMNTKGEYGAATSIQTWTDVRSLEEYTGFPFAVWQQASNQPHRVETVPPTSHTQ